MSTSVPKLVLYDFPAKTGLPGWGSFSPFVMEVERALKLAKLPFDHQYVNMLKLKKELNPTGQLPVLRIGDELVADSTRILHRLEALAPGSMTGGLTGSARDEVWLWEEFADTALYPFPLATRWADDRGWPVPKKHFFGGLPPVVRDLIGNMVRKKTIQALEGRDFLRGGLDACYDRMGRVLDHLEGRAPEDAFWLGPRVTAADLGLFAHLHALRLPMTPVGVELVARRKRLSRYLDRVDAATS